MSQSTAEKAKKKVDSHILRKYDLQQIIGEGAYGIVWKAIEKKTKRVVALKKIFDAFRNSTDAQRTYREVMLLLNLKYSHVVRLWNVFRAKNDLDLYLVFEFHESNLHSVIRANILQEIHHRYIIYQLCKTLKYLHSGNLIHRDIKPANLLINTECKLVLADFGLSRTIDSVQDDDVVFTDYIATRWYRSPEILLGCKKYHPSVDIWAVGCIIGEILLGKPMFRGSSTVNQLQKVMQYVPKPPPSVLEKLDSENVESMMKLIPDEPHKPLKKLLPMASPVCLDLVEKMMKFMPEDRISAAEALKHPYLKEFHQTSLEPSLDKTIQLYFNDNKKYKTQDYRQQLYHVIRQLRKKRRARAEKTKKP